MSKLKTIILSYLLSVIVVLLASATSWLFVACYDATKVPRCGPPSDYTWPDPCALNAQDASVDAATKGNTR